MRRKTVLAITLPVSLAACASLPTLPSLPDSGTRSIIVSSKTSAEVSACVTLRWQTAFKIVTQVSNGRASEIRVESDGRTRFEAEIIPQTVGSTIVYTVPYGLAQPVERSYDDVRACAAK